jgi:hypothetical protein
MKNPTQIIAATLTGALSALKYTPVAMSLINQSAKPTVRPFNMPFPGIEAYTFAYITPNIAPKIVVMIS